MLRAPSLTRNIMDHFNSTTSNIIYCIQCSNCNKLYIGETGRRLGDRTRDHLYVKRHNNLYPNLSLAILILLIILFLILLRSIFPSSTAVTTAAKLKKCN